MAARYGKVFQRRGRWWIYYRHRGQEYTQSVARILGIPPRGVTERMAQQVLEQRIREVYEGSVVLPKHQRLTVGECLDQLVQNMRLRGVQSLALYEGMARRLKPEVGGWRAADLTTAVLEQLALSWRETSEHAPSYINDRLRFLRQAVQLAVDRHQVTRAPKVTMLKVDNVREQVVTPEMWTAIREELSGVYLDVCEFAWLSGWRKSEIIRLVWTALDIPGRRLRIEVTKNDDPRVLPLDADLWAVIDRRWRQRSLGQGAVFHLFGRDLCESTVRRQFQEGAKRAGFPGLVFHDLRRSAVTNMIDAGVPEMVAMKISGHRTLSMLTRYHVRNVKTMLDGLERTRVYVRQRLEGVATTDKTPTISPVTGPSSKNFA